MTNQTGLDGLIAAIELAAPSLATLMGGPLAGVLANSVVSALQKNGVGADLTAPTPADITPAAIAAPLDLLQMALSALDQQASDHLNEVSAISPAAGAPATLPHSDSGVQVNSVDNLTKLCIAITGAVVAAVGITSPTAASFLNGYVPVIGGLLATGLGIALSHRSVARSNANTAALQNQAIR
jgi:hypothetical protein